MHNDGTVWRYTGTPCSHGACGGWFALGGAASPATLVLSRESLSMLRPSGQDPGFFTSVSSNGTQPGTAVIWAVARPANANPAQVTLYALDAANARQLFAEDAGTWPNTGGNANIVPTVANGHVFVASNKELAIFGLGTAMAVEKRAVVARARTEAVQSAAAPALAPGEHETFGIVESNAPGKLTLRKRDGTLVKVDTTKAEQQNTMGIFVVGRSADVRGTIGADGTISAQSVIRAKGAPPMWRADR
jgi:hypothetical protein